MHHIPRYQSRKIGREERDDVRNILRPADPLQRLPTHHELSALFHVNGGGHCISRYSPRPDQSDDLGSRNLYRHAVDRTHTAEAYRNARDAEGHGRAVSLGSFCCGLENGTSAEPTRVLIVERSAGRKKEAVRERRSELLAMIEPKCCDG